MKSPHDHSAHVGHHHPPDAGPTDTHQTGAQVAEHHAHAGMHGAAPMAGHDDHRGHAEHDRHAGHSVSMFRDKFWLSLLLTVPTLVWGHMLP